jgi:DNA polymerase III alpha subunit
MGFQPAPSYIQNSEALNKAREYAAENSPPGTRTQEQADRANIMHALEQQAQNKKIDRNAIKELVEQGKLTDADVRRAMLLGTTPQIVRASRSLSLEQSLHVFELATPEEKQHLRPLLAKKAETQLREVADPDRRRQLVQAVRVALHSSPPPVKTATEYTAPTGR